MKRLALVKKALPLTMTLLFTSGMVSASSMNGDFEGNSIVKVMADGKELQVEDVPAINYKDRTMVPIYLLKQLGADVVWNNANYSVNVTLNKNTEKTDEQKANEEKQAKKAIYEWLSDTDMAIWMYAVKLQQYANMDSSSDLQYKIDQDYNDLFQLYSDSMNYAQEKAKGDSAVSDIIAKQSEAMTSLDQVRNTVKIWLKDKTLIQVGSNLKYNLLSTLTVAQNNFTSTKRIIRQLLLNW